jgi:fatty acid desaturase
MGTVSAKERRWEWPTFIAWALVFGGWFAVTATADAWPRWLLPLAGGYLMAWHGSLQHEAIHGHPTRKPWLNMLLVGAPLGLWLPYGLYRDSHLAHHQDSQLTLPGIDPESYYVPLEAWSKMGRVRRALLWVNQTALGRLIVGPWKVLAEFFASELSLLLRGDLARLRVWGLHALWCGAIVLWLSFVGLSFAEYVLFFVYPGLSLTLLRSFIEHRPARGVPERIAVVEAAWPLGLLFLHNNLHAVHHQHPGVPWYALPALYRAARERIVRENGGYRFAGYGQVLWRYAFRPKDSPVHPWA